VLLVKQSPWIGVGYHADELIAEIGAVNQAGKNIAVHGGLMNVVTSGGLMGLVLFLIGLSLLYKSFGTYGRMLLMGGLVSQFGADIYSLTGFWIVVGICLFYDRKHKELQEKKNSTSYPKMANI
jgi:O-antigen ligase